MLVEGRFPMRALLLLIGLILAGPLTFAQSAGGVWEGEYWFMNRLEKATFTFKVDGDKLTGQVSSYLGDRKIGDFEIVDGKIESDRISFETPVNFGPSVKAIEYSGTVSGNEIAFMRWMQGWKHQAEALFPRSSQFTATRQ
jgi:hypothetical protein